MNDRQKYVFGKTGRLIYVAGPMRLGSVTNNVRLGCDAGMALMQAGWTPVVPQLSQFWATVSGDPSPGHADGAEGWLAYDFRLVAACDAVVRLPGESTGADREVALAKSLGIPVFTLDEALRRGYSGEYV